MLETEIVKLREAIEAMTRAISAQPQQSEPQPEQQSETQPEPRVEQPVETISFEMIKDATLKASRAGHKDAIRNQLASIGVSKIQDLDAAQSGVFYAWLGGLGQ